MADKRPPIDPNPPRWKPNPDATTIHVPGLDTSASMTDQIDQIEQLITIKLQNIDENFAKIQNVLANRLLPAVKRYAMGTEPVREAAKFWTAFYEQAAQIRIPTMDDYSTVNDVSSEREDIFASKIQENESTEMGSNSRSHQENHSSNVLDSESSFMPGQAAFSSTPARGSKPQDSFASRGGSDPSWTRSMESPLVRLSREVQSLSVQDENISAQSSSFASFVKDTIQKPKSVHHRGLPRSNKGKGKEAAQPLLHGIFKHNIYSTNESSFSCLESRIISPQNTRGTAPKQLDHHIPPDTKSQAQDWKGLFDLRDPSILASPRSQPQKTTDPGNISLGSTSRASSSVLISPAPSSVELGLVALRQTPSKEAVARITRDLVREQQMIGSDPIRNLFEYSTRDIEGESSMSTMPTPPSLSRYQKDDTDDSFSLGGPSFDSMMRRVVQSNSNPISRTKISTPGLRLRPRPGRPALSRPTGPGPRHDPDTMQNIPTTKDEQRPVVSESKYDEATREDSFSDSDSLDEVNNTAHPSAAFLMASRRSNDSDDSGDSLVEEDANIGIGLVPVHPFAGGVEDDGFDDDDSLYVYDGNAAGAEEETLFGPGQRPVGNADGLRILGEELDTIGFQARFPDSEHTTESPTPASWKNLRG